jgi:hypothetical protein
MKLLPLLFAMVLLAGCTNSEEQAFKRARMTDTVVGWENFLRDFPDGEETAAARRRLVELHEDREWQRAQLADSVAAYQEYLQGYPQGRFSGEALVRIANLNLREIPDHEPTPEELRAAHVARMAGKAVDAGGTPKDPSLAVAAKPVAAPKPAPTSGTRGPTALISRAPPQTVRAPKPAPKPAPAPTPAPAPAPKPVAVKSAPVVAPPPPAPPVLAPATAGQSWAIQLGAFGKGEAAALQHWQRLQRLVPAAVTGLSPEVLGPVEGKAFHRLRVVGLTRERAREVCIAVRDAGEGCVVTAP